MTDQPANHLDILYRFAPLSTGYWRSEHKWKACFLLASMVLMGVLQVGLVIRLNLWSADLFDAIERRSDDGFFKQVIIFTLLVASVMLVNMLHLAAKRGLQIGWREWLTHCLLDSWMADARHYQISLLPGDHSNPDGRIADDIRIATESAIELIHSGLYCLMLFVSFSTILWSLSGVLQISIAGFDMPLYGHMVWLALLYASAGSVLAFMVGGRLVEATNQRQTAEADFRFMLAKARENAEAIALVRREPQERRRLQGMLRPIRQFWDAQTTGLRHLMLFSSAYSVLATMFPILVASPRYLAGAITLGVLMQTGQAFQQMTAALSWPIDNFPRMAEWQASVERILALYDAATGQKFPAPNARIVVSATAGPDLAIRDLAIASPENGTLASGINATIQPGERVLIAGDNEVGLMLFKAVTGIWLWGAGHIELPDNAEIVFVPPRPYFPTESLREILAFPEGEKSGGDGACRQALAVVGLERLQSSLDTAEPWMQVLSQADQQRLACANLLLRRPTWVFMAYATDSLEKTDEIGLLERLYSELPVTTFLTLSHHAHLENMHSRMISLERTGGMTITVREEERREAAMPEHSVGRIRRLLEYIKEGLA